MRILLTNDDGINAPGLAALYPRLASLGEVIVVAPSDCRSGTSHSITYIDPLRVEPHTVEGLFSGTAVHGSPADCVKIATDQLLQEPVDLVVSGINDGANVGINMYYSGTVAAAFEAALVGLPAIAFSVSSSNNVDFDRAADLSLEVLKSLLPIQPKDLINVNIPHERFTPPKGIRVVPQAIEGFKEYYKVQPIPNTNENRYQLTAGPFNPDGEVTDAAILEQGYISITPLHVNMTHYAGISALENRLPPPNSSKDPS